MSKINKNSMPNENMNGNAMPAEINQDGQLYVLVQEGDGWAYEPVSDSPAPSPSLWDSIQPPQPIPEVYMPSTEAASVEDLLEIKRRALAAAYGIVTPLEREIADLEKNDAEAKRLKAEALNYEALSQHLASMNGNVLLPVKPVTAPSFQPTAGNSLEVEASRPEGSPTVKGKEKTKDKAPKTKMSRRRQLGTVGVIVAGAVVATGGGLALTGNTFGLGGTNASISPDKKVAVDPDTIPDLSSASIVDAFGGCLDERGAGPALYSGMFDATATSTYEFTNLAGGKTDNHTY